MELSHPAWAFPIGWDDMPALLTRRAAASVTVVCRGDHGSGVLCAENSPKGENANAKRNCGHGIKTQNAPASER